MPIDSLKGFTSAQFDLVIPDRNLQHNLQLDYNWSLNQFFSHSTLTASR